MKSGCLRSLNVICFFWPNHETELRSAPGYIDMISSLLILSSVLCQAAQQLPTTKFFGKKSFCLLVFVHIKQQQLKSAGVFGWPASKSVFHIKFLRSPRNRMQNICTPCALKLVEFVGFSKITFDTVIKMLFHMKTLKGCLRLSFKLNVLSVDRV